MILAALDLERVLTPEIWLDVAEQTGIDELRRTTRDEPDYDVLMKQRLEVLATRGVGLPDLQAVIASMQPLPGARTFLDWLREHFQVVILSDTFYPFAEPLMRQLGFPTLLCHDLDVDDAGRIVDIRIRLRDQKRRAVSAFRDLNFRIVAAGDSYNDISMLAEADAGILFRPPDKVMEEFPQCPVTHSYDELRAAFLEARERCR